MATGFQHEAQRASGLTCGDVLHRDEAVKRPQAAMDYQVKIII
ncbi:MAG: hypothetical protein ACK4VW_07340 [Anaerolineales bacterium]